MLHVSRVPVWLLAATLLLVAGHAQERPRGSAPQERPRSRPPSELTGWAEWEKAETLLQRIAVPPAPPLAPQEALKTFRLAPGYRLELVAAEPLVNTPIFFEFDPDGRIWVVEYQGYMRDLRGTGEGDPICRIVVLEDTDEDGRADTSTVFLDGLVMPRSLAFVKGGVIVAEPPHLWLCADDNDDRRCDRKVRIGDYGHAGNPQHTANGLRYGLDNWLHSADVAKRHRVVDGRLLEEDVPARGQFGVSFDDEGRFLTSRENRALIADLIPAEYGRRNPNLIKSYQQRGSRDVDFGINVDIAREAQQIFPSRVTPAVTLGALELRDDGRLATYTVVSGSGFYNGDQFPADAYGNVFVPDSGGHLVGRLQLTGDIAPHASRFYPDEQEFLTSTDERFRPVNSRVGPDGALYLADMYRGVIEHVIFMVPYLEKQIRDRRLEDGLDRGRIYRVVNEGKPIDRRAPRLAGASSSALVERLSHANGWWRLTAQRLLVERRDPASVPPLKDLVRSGPAPLGRLHALWTLQGLQALDLETLVAAGSDSDDRVRSAAVRLVEHLSPSAPSDRVLAALERRLDDPSPKVRLQLVLTLGAYPGEKPLQLMLSLVRSGEHELFRAAAMMSVGGRELPFLGAWLSVRPPAQGDHHYLQTSRWLAELIMHDGRGQQVERLLALIEHERTPAIRQALLDGMAAAVPSRADRVVPIALGREPGVLRELLQSPDRAVAQSARRVRTALTWPGAPALPLETAGVPPLAGDDRRLAERGAETYARLCAVCHQLDGAGTASVAPRLTGSRRVEGPTGDLIRIVLHGLYGPMDVDGETWNRHMPGLGGVLGDQEIAATLTYIRRAWGNVAPPVQPAQVAAVRQETSGRALAWTAAELPGETKSGASVRAATAIHPRADGVLELPARLAVTYGRELAYRPSLDILAPWRHEQDVAEWHVEVASSGAYEVRVTLAADEASAGDAFVVASAGSQVRGVVRASGRYDTFHEYDCGTIQLAAGRNRIVMRPDGPLRRELADVRSLTLLPRKP
jgi:mono/diheme cytochrome c family protein/glucose/arabinose dehydrogenase